MTYKIYSGDDLINRIEADEEFVTSYCAENDYRFELDAENETDMLATIKVVTIDRSKRELEEYLDANPMTWTDGKQYSVTKEKQELLSSQLTIAQMAVTMQQDYNLKWNSSGGIATEWQLDDLVQLAIAIGSYVQPFVNYQQSIEISINNCTTTDEVRAISFDYSAAALK